MAVMYDAGINVLLKYRKKISPFTNPVEFYMICCGLSDHHYGSALLYLQKKDIRSSVKHILKGFVNNPLSVKPWCFFLKRYIPIGGR